MKLRSSILAVVFALTMAAGIVSPVSAAVSWSVTIAPPPLPVYAQPVSPGPDYLWTPGYWAWNGDDFYWVPATWVLAPQPGYLWTPGYWGWRDGLYVFNEGYWGPTIGFYGGIDYGFGYWGHGYDGGRWQGDHFFYNRAVTHVDETSIKNVYTSRVNNVTVDNVSYNGGSGGVRAEATPAEMAAAREGHLPPVAAQRQHAEAARNEPQLRAAVNHGRPSIVATQRPNELSGRSMVAARQEQRASEAPQDADHQRIAANKQQEQREQEMEQEHQRQTQEMAQRHAQEREQMQARHRRPKPDEEERHG